jgi:hypothetical protein
MTDESEARTNRATTAITMDERMINSTAIQTVGNRRAAHHDRQKPAP